MVKKGPSLLQDREPNEAHWATNERRKKGTLHLRLPLRVLPRDNKDVMSVSITHLDLSKLILTNHI